MIAARGASSHKPVIGDWNGDGKDTIGVFHGGVWELSNGDLAGGGGLSADISFTYGNPSDTPITGDWRGYRYTAIGVKQDDVYQLRNTLSGGIADISFVYGLSSDKAVFGRWGCLSGLTGGMNFQGPMAACMLASTATPTLPPTSTSIPSIDQTRTATYAATYTQGGCVLRVQTGAIKSLMDNNLATVLTTIPQGAILVATKGRGRLQQQPDGYFYLYISYGTQSGWIYTRTGLEMYPPAVVTSCDTLPLERLDYQAPTLSSPPDSQLLYNYNQPLNCTMPITPPMQAQCIYNAFQSLFIQTYQRPPTMKEILGLIVQAEWWAYQGNTGQAGHNLGTSASEGISRAYFGICTKGICQPSQLFTFLSGCQPWLLGDATPGQVAQILLQRYAAAVGQGAPLANAIDTIFNPLPSDPYGIQVNANWATQGQCVRPWQWFTFQTTDGSFRPLGTANNQVYDRFRDVPANGQSFEIFTLGQAIVGSCGG